MLIFHPMLVHQLHQHQTGTNLQSPVYTSKQFLLGILAGLFFLKVEMQKEMTAY